MLPRWVDYVTEKTDRRSPKLRRHEVSAIFQELLKAGVSLNRSALMKEDSAKIKKITHSILGMAITGTEFVELVAASGFDYQEAYLKSFHLPKLIGQAMELLAAELSLEELRINKLRENRTESVKEILRSVFGRDWVGGGTFIRFIQDQGYTWTQALQWGKIRDTDFHHIASADIPVLLKAIQELDQEGFELNWKAIQKERSPKFQEVMRRVLGRPIIGTSFLGLIFYRGIAWDDALRKAGFDPKEIRLRFWRRANLSRPHQLEILDRASGRQIRILGKPTPTPDSIVENREFYDVLFEEIEFHFPEDRRETILAAIDHIIGNKDTLTLQELAGLLQEQGFTGVIPEQLLECFSLLSHSTRLRSFQEGNP